MQNIKYMENDLIKHGIFFYANSRMKKWFNTIYSQLFLDIQTLNTNSTKSTQQFSKPPIMKIYLLDPHHNMDHVREHTTDPDLPLETQTTQDTQTN